MKKSFSIPGIVITLFFLAISSGARGFARQNQPLADTLAERFKKPPESAKPWVFWYWMNAAVTADGITADLEAMKEAGIGGAYLMPIQGAGNPPLINPPAEQLSPLWWQMVRHAVKEADRLNIKLAMHDCDGFALAGGPWITPELSMQKVVWTELNVTGGRKFNDVLPQPQTIRGYYKDIAVYAFPAPEGTGLSSYTIQPEVTTSLPDVDASSLAKKNNRQNFKSKESCWIQYAFDKPFTCRSIRIKSSGYNYQANRLLLEVSDDGKQFRQAERLQPPRNGWQDSSAVTHAIVPVTARFFRFIYDNEGSEPGAEDLDAAKWKQSLSVRQIELSSEPRIDQFEGKNGSVWRISGRTTSQQLPDSLCIPADKIINITSYMAPDGRLTWNVPSGNWIILRMGHTSTGSVNTTGGAGKGLECDKFNPEAAKVQFDHWFGEATRQIGPELTARVLKMFHIDSWECGSQNWSPVFRNEFKKRRGYDPLPYLPAYAGIPIGSADVSERFLNDVRQTIAELVSDNFYGTMARLAHEKGCTFSGESIAPTMVSDGMLHYKQVDIPMGEFWFRSPTHDKPNDMLDAISGAHIYGKQIVQAEAFTELRLRWDEHPGMLKTLQDRNYALGINRMVYHVFVHNPWLDRKPGMTLNGVGNFFQRDQTWWKQSKAWNEYTQRCQALLQLGHPVADVAVFTGEGTPRRAVLPDRLVPVLPGIFGPEVVEKEKKRLANKGLPLQEIPDNVKSSANMSDPANWIDPLHGYAYDSFNRDALLNLTKVKNGRLELPGGAAYNLLVVPGALAMSPDSTSMSPEVAARLLELAKGGATLLINEKPYRSVSLEKFPESDKSVRQSIQELLAGKAGIQQVGKGRIIQRPFQETSFESLGIEPDVLATDLQGHPARNLAWTHRTAPDFDIYFLSNQLESRQTVNLSLRVNGRVPELWNPLTGEIKTASDWQFEKRRTLLPIRLEPAGSVFVVFRRAAKKTSSHEGKNWTNTEAVQTISGAWTVRFDKNLGGPEKPVVFNQLTDWSKNTDYRIKYYSGTASYSKTFTWKSALAKKQRIWLDLGNISNVAEVKLNGISCGVAWTAPYRVEITKALKEGTNKLEIEVTNTWANRLMGDHNLPEEQRVTWTNASYRLEGKPLLEAGLLGPVKLVVGKNEK